MAGFPGNNRKLGSAGIPPGAAPPIVTETTNTGTDSFYISGLVFAEDIAPFGASNPPANVTATGSTGTTDTYYIMGVVLSESGAPGSSGGTFNVTQTGSVGSDTYYILGIVFGEK